MHYSKLYFALCPTRHREIMIEKINKTLESHLLISVYQELTDRIIIKLVRCPIGILREAIKGKGSRLWKISQESCKYYSEMLEKTFLDRASLFPLVVNNYCKYIN